MDTIKGQAKFLEIRAHCVGIKFTSPITMEKYFIYDNFIYEKNITESYGFIVTYEKIRDFKVHKEVFIPKQILKASPEEVQLKVDCMGLCFGE